MLGPCLVALGGEVIGDLGCGVLLWEVHCQGQVGDVQIHPISSFLSLFFSMLTKCHQSASHSNRDVANTLGNT